MHRVAEVAPGQEIREFPSQVKAPDSWRGRKLRLDQYINHSIQWKEYCPIFTEQGLQIAHSKVRMNPEIWRVVDAYTGEEMEARL